MIIKHQRIVMQHSGSLILKKMKEKIPITVNFFQDDTTRVWPLVFGLWLLILEIYVVNIISPVR